MGKKFNNWIERYKNINYFINNYNKTYNKQNNYRLI